jgi:CubicO group peptidase (beta-lactamase class C family)
MRKAILLFAFATPFFSGAQKPTDPRLKGLDTFVARVLKEWHAPAVTIAVVEKNKVVYTGGFGYRDLEKKLPVTENTLFAIGSCTKAFTASMIGMLQQEEKLDIDKPVRNYLPELKFYNEYTNNHATLRDMMTHRTGLPRHDFSWYGSTATRNELLERIQYLEPSAELREKYQYNNFMFLAQGVVIEKLTGKPWEQNLRERILIPLGMSRTVMSIAELEKSGDRSPAFSVKNDSIVNIIPYRNTDAIGPAGSINSCSKDMAHWLIAWINNGKFNGKTIIPASFRNQAIVPQMVTGGGLPGPEHPDIHLSGYGFAWGLASYRGHYRVEHGGGIDGFLTTTSFFPSDSIGIFVSSSQNDVSIVIRNFIADRMLKLPYFNWYKQQFDLAQKAKAAPKQPNADSIQQKLNTKPNHERSEYAATYTSKGYGDVKIFLQNDTLWVDYNEGGQKTKAYLQHYHYDVFRIRSTDEQEDNPSAPKLRFVTNSKGEISSFETQMEPAVKDIVFEKISTAPALVAGDLEKYTGEYEFAPGVFAKVYLANEKLKMLLEGQPEYELIPAGKNRFDLRNMSGFTIQFEENDKGEITSLSSIQPNGIFKAPKKK